MKLLHIASFTGNIGDNCSHNGFRKILDSIDLKVNKLDKVEIRDFYNNRDMRYKRFFDPSFAEYANTYDIIVIGGGGFLDYFVEGSETGTTIDMSKSVLDSIKTPILLSSVGCVPNRPVPDGNKELFLDFLNYIKNRENMELLLRNDGSIKHIRNDFGSEISSCFHHILDNGFHYELNKKYFFQFKRKFIAINMSYDQLTMSGNFSHKLDTSWFYRELSKVVEYIIHDLQLDVCLVPHIYQDLIGINDIISELDDYTVRDNIFCAPYVQHDEGSDLIYSIYNQSELVVGSRLHSNIGCMSMGKKTIGLSTLMRVREVYHDIGMGEFFVNINKNFSSNLCLKIKTTLSADKSQFYSNLMSRINPLRKSSIDIYRKSFD
ncbi:polysaccharide pyruvyl transferase family protein, partial [Alphaproteobacteria bacterium]|nr:polysaccharide pyruvyl transferase family protein [Alphaproteobacteria bacterium]